MAGLGEVPLRPGHGRADPAGIVADIGNGHGTLCLAAAGSFGGSRAIGLDIEAGLNAEAARSRSPTSKCGRAIPLRNRRQDPPRFRGIHTGRHRVAFQEVGRLVFLIACRSHLGEVPPSPPDG